MMAAGNTRRSRLALALLAATMLTPLDGVEAAPGDPVGGEFQVNSFTTGDQNWPAIAADADGDFVVVWQSDGQDGSGHGVYAQRYNAAGDAVGGEFRVNTTTADEQLFPAVAMDTDGDFVVTWIGVDSGLSLIFAQRFDAAGVAQGGEFRVGGLDPAPGPPAVAMNDAGGFVVAWTATTGVEVYDILAQRFDGAGTPQGGEFLVSATSADLHAEPAVAMDADGDFVVTWESGSLSGDRDILARRYSSAGVAQGGEFRVNANTAQMQVHTAVAMDADGDFVVTWDEWDSYGGGYNSILARRYDSAGVAQGDEFRVNTGTTDSRSSAVAMDADGGFVVAWHSLGGSGWNAFARRYAGTGVSLGAEFRVNANTTDGGWVPDVAMQSDGDFVVAWAGNDGDPVGGGVLGRRFEGGGQLAARDFDADGTSDILWRNSSDGRTVVWQMNGFLKEATAGIGNPSSAWKVQDIGDFDGSGHADILWRNTGTGSTVIWQMMGLEMEAAASIGTVGGAWEAVAVGDFDGDQKADILWRNTNTGSAVIWLMNGMAKGAAAAIGAPPLAWSIAGVDDFNGDGRSDILWRNPGSGATAIWQMDGFTRIADSTIGGSVGGDWKITATADFDGDAKADILWRNATSGNTVIWQMNGLTKQDAQSIGTVALGWHVARAGDYDGDGMADILWRNTASGNTVIWKMSGLAKEDASSIGLVSGGWRIR